MILTDKAEEILESLWVALVEEKKQKSDIGILKADDVIKELVDASCAELDGDKIMLTRKGKEEAGHCIRRHRLAERLFVDVLDIKKKLVHDTSCKFEHLLHKGLDENICILLGHPKVCPHGKPIPQGPCCREARRMPAKLIMPLPELGVNKKAKVSHLHTQDHDKIQKIIAIGALPNTEIKLVQKFPSYVFQIGKSQFAVDKELALCIYVRII